MDGNNWTYSSSSSSTRITQSSSRTVYSSSTLPRDNALEEIIEIPTSTRTAPSIITIAPGDNDSSIVFQLPTIIPSVTVGKRTSTEYSKSTSTRTINGVSTTNSEEHLKNDSNRFTIDNSDPSTTPNISGTRSKFEYSRKSPTRMEDESGRYTIVDDQRSTKPIITTKVYRYSNQDPKRTENDNSNGNNAEFVANELNRIRNDIEQLNDTGLTRDSGLEHAIGLLSSHMGGFGGQRRVQQPDSSSNQTEHVNNVNSLKNSIEELNAQKEHLSKELNKLKAENSQHSNELHSIKTQNNLYIKEIQKLKLEIEKISNDYHALKAEKEKIDKALKEKDHIWKEKLEAEIKRTKEAHSNEINKLQTEKGELWNDFKVVKSEKEKMDKALKEKDSKQEAENKRTKELHSSELNKLQADKDELWNDFKVLKSEKEKAEKKYLEKETKFKDEIKKEKERNKDLKSKANPLKRYNKIKAFEPGAYGIVHLVEDRKIKTKDNEYFKKVMKRIIKDPKAEKEYSIYLQLSHENVLKYYDHFENEEDGLDYIYIITEYCQKGDFKQLIVEAKKAKTKGKVLLKDTQILDLITQAANGLRYLHKKKIIHRDIKPGNLLLSDDNVVKLADLGESKDIKDDPDAHTYVGTKQYMSPEQSRGQQLDEENYETHSFNTDVWSLGCVLYEMIFLDFAFKHGQGSDPDIPSLSGARGFTKVLRKMLVKDPKKRINSENLYSDLVKLASDKENSN